eukprot:UN26775
MNSTKQSQHYHFVKKIIGGVAVCEFNGGFLGFSRCPFRIQHQVHNFRSCEVEDFIPIHHGLLRF